MSGQFLLKDIFVNFDAIWCKSHIGLSLISQYQSQSKCSISTASFLRDLHLKRPIFFWGVKSLAKLPPKENLLLKLVFHPTTNTLRRHLDTYNIMKTHPKTSQNTSTELQEVFLLETAAVL